MHELKATPRERRKDLTKRTHTVTITDQQMMSTYDEWKELTSHTDNPTMEDAVILRKMLAERVGRDLEMICLFWMRNEMVALRKK